MGMIEHEQYDCIICFDGGARPNPGPGGAGAVVFCGRSGAMIESFSAAIPKAYKRGIAANTAEYLGLLIGLKSASLHGHQRVLVRGDSGLIIGHMQAGDKARITFPLLVELNHLARELEKRFERVDYALVQSDNNQLADGLASDGVWRAQGGQCSTADLHTENPIEIELDWDQFEGGYGLSELSEKLNQPPWFC